MYLKYWRLFAIAFTLFTNSLTISYIYPFAGDMVMKFGLVDNIEEEGKYAVWIIMSFFIGRSFTVAKWGKFSDTYGRKTGILLSQILIIIVLVIYAFVNSFWFAVVGRFILGMASGLSPICKSTLTEILPKDRNAEAVGYASAV